VPAADTIAPSHARRMTLKARRIARFLTDAGSQDLPAELARLDRDAADEQWKRIAELAGEDPPGIACRAVIAALLEDL
jgi:hypothetical protein